MCVFFVSRNIVSMYVLGNVLKNDDNYVEGDFNPITIFCHCADDTLTPFQKSYLRGKLKEQTVIYQTISPHAKKKTSFTST